MIRWRAVNPPGSASYHHEPYTVQHFTDWLKQCGLDAWHVIQLLVSKKRRMDMARAYNQAVFGGIPTEQIMVTDSETGEFRPLREEERTWPE